MQINLNKSEKAHLDLINEKVSQIYDVMLIQEPYATPFRAIRTPANFRPVLPKNRIANEEPIRSVIWVSRHLETKNWKIVDIPGTNNITAIQLKGAYGKILIFNIYNDCTHSRNEVAQREFLDTHMIWAGDFNRHHPLWDDDKDTHLFTRQALRDAEGIIDLIAEFDMVMTLPKGIPTLQHMRTKKYSRPDNLFCNIALQPYIIKCEVQPWHKPSCTDHYPIVTHLDLPQTRIPEDPSYNFRTADWDKFNKALKIKLSNLKIKLSNLPQPGPFTGSQQLFALGDSLTKALQETIQEKFTCSKPRPDAKRWWNSDLTGMRKELNRLRSLSYKNRTITNHPSHRELRRKSKVYGKAIISEKRAHWAEYLEDMVASDIWTANKYLKNPVGDGGLPRIPTIRVRDAAGSETEINDNEDKAKVFVKSFFPPPPTAQEEDPTAFKYPEPLPNPPLPDRARIERTIRKLPSYKAPGPDGIPNTA
jgi:hypothetical protein